MSVWRYMRCIQVCFMPQMATGALTPKLLILDYFSRPLSIYCLPTAVYAQFYL